MDLNLLQDKAMELFESGINCAQSVFAPFAEEYGLHPEIALKIASTFGGGMKMGSVCGALTGALMVLGLFEGYSIHSDSEKERISKITQKMTGRWKEEFGTVDCSVIRYFSPVERMSLAEDVLASFSRNRCTYCVVFAVSLLHETLMDAKSSNKAYNIE